MSNYIYKTYVPSPPCPPPPPGYLPKAPKGGTGMQAPFKSLSSYTKEELIDTAIDKYIQEGKTLDLVEKITRLFKK
jgi:hypothetical protein